MTRFREDGRLREWTADPTDPLPQGLIEDTQLTSEVFSIKGRVALVDFFPEEEPNGNHDPVSITPEMTNGNGTAWVEDGKLRLFKDKPEDTDSRYADSKNVSAAREDPSIFDALLNDYMGFITYIAKGYFMAGSDQQDVIQEGMIGFYKAVRDYNGSLSFGNFVKLCVTRQITSAIKTANRYKHVPLNTYVSFAAQPAGHKDDYGTMTIEDTLPAPEPSVTNIVEST